jgi:hypothetical protein
MAEALRDIDFDAIREIVREHLGRVPETLGTLETWQAAVIIPVGLISLLYGLKLFRGVVVVYAAMTGAAAGWLLATHFELSTHLEGDYGNLIAAAGGGVVLGLLAWPLLNVAVGVFGGVAGAATGALVVYWMEEPTYVLIAAGAGLVAGVLLAILVFRGLVIFMTSLLGAVLVVAGVTALLMHVESAAERVAAGLNANRYLLPVLVGVPAIIGGLYQAHETEAEEKKKGDD